PPLPQRHGRPPVPPPARPVVLGAPGRQVLPAARPGGGLRRPRQILPAELGQRPEVPLPVPGAGRRRPPVPTVLLRLEVVLPVRAPLRRPLPRLRAPGQRPGRPAGGTARRAGGARRRLGGAAE